MGWRSEGGEEKLSINWITRSDLFRMGWTRGSEGGGARAEERGRGRGQKRVTKGGWRGKGYPCATPLLGECEEGCTRKTTRHSMLPGVERAFI
jgi:hypothetical protein